VQQRLDITPPGRKLVRQNQCCVEDDADAGHLEELFENNCDEIERQSIFGIAKRETRYLESDRSYDVHHQAGQPEDSDRPEMSPKRDKVLGPKKQARYPKHSGNNDPRTILSNKR